MTRDESRAMCIEAMAEALFIADGGGILSITDGTPHAVLDWKDAAGLARQYYITRATAAFDAAVKVFVLPTEATGEMAAYRAMAAAGDLTNPPEKKT